MRRQKGFSLIEVLIVVLIIGIIAIPNMLAAKRSANEASAVGSMRAILSAQDTYKETEGEGKRFAATLQDLAPLHIISVKSILDPDLSDDGVKCGYRFTLIGFAAGPEGGTPYYDLNGDPLSFGTWGSGNKWFYTNEKYQIYYSTTRAITPPSSPNASGYREPPAEGVELDQ